MNNMNNSIFMARHSAFSPYRMIRREIGFGLPIGAGDAMAKSLYCGMKPLASWDSEQANTLPTGGVFNLEFSPEGSLLVAACEKKSIQIFDPLTHQRIHSVDGAHTDCVNCVKFLDGRMFATCSDDTTIALWDVRNLKKKIRSLLGHSNWVKNIEFSVKDQLLVTSGLDGSIYTWDINSYTEFNLVYQRVFHASGLMRCRLSPDARQMVMCTTGGLLIIVHDLNLATLAQDLHGFKPNLYRLMQMSQQLIPIAAMYDHLFDSKRKENRVEFVTDFPEGNDAQVVSALQIHPQGWSALSRNISHDDRSEWSCIHDIQPMEEPSDKAVRDAVCLRRPPRAPRRRVRPYRPHHRHMALAALHAATPSVAAAIGPLPIPLRPAMAGETPSVYRASTDFISTPRRRSARLQDRDSDSGSSRSRLRTEPSTSGSSGTSGTTGPSGTSEASGSGRGGGGLSSIQNDVWEASITIKQHRMLQELYSRGQVGRNFNMQRIMGINTGITPPQTASTDRATQPLPQSSSSLPSTSGSSREGCTSCGEENTRHFIRQNRDRLLYYIEETNEGKGFIKELCFSSDGRLVCSPFGRGMRLLALTESCSELSTCVPQDGALRLQEVGSSTGMHGDLVVSSKFSPRHHILVTGCLEGRIVWYEPYSGETLH